LDLSDRGDIVLHMGSNGDATAALKRRGPKARVEPTTPNGIALQAWLDAQGFSRRHVSRATGLHLQTVVRTITGDPARQSCATRDAWLAFGAPPELFRAAG
jgi:hypothetical protein